MEFVAHDEVFGLFPGLRLAVVVAAGLDGARGAQAAGEEWRREWEAASAHAVHGNAQSHPRVAPWRERMRAAGASPRDFPSSIESLLRRALKGGDPFRIDPVVDWYNAVSLRHVCPAGGFDLGQVAGPLELRLARPGDTFHALDEEAPAAVPPGEVAYADGATVLTRHFVWKQSRTALIGPGTQDVFLVSEVLGEVEEGVAEAVASDLRRGAEETFGGRVLAGAVLREGSARLAW
ncbi:MAG: hypothetical protein HY658_03880 [Actinobacteria bacterium]|nr:hypothetical protein [Actinomycetota bacterium]